MAGPKIDLSFLERNVTSPATARVSRTGWPVRSSKRIDAVLTAEPNRADKPVLLDARQKWLDMAPASAENANTTSSSSISTTQIILSTSST